MTLDQMDYRNEVALKFALALSGKTYWGKSHFNTMKDAFDLADAYIATTKGEEIDKTKTI